MHSCAALNGSMATAELIDVAVVYALPSEQRLSTVRVPSGSTVARALRDSGILERFPEIDVKRAKLGVFGRRVSPEDVLRDGDRIEIYRELIADPKSARRKRVQQSAKKT